MRLFSKNPPVEETDEADPKEIAPQTAEEFLNRGYAFYARKEYKKAEEDLHQAIEKGANPADANYTLGLVLKHQDERTEDAVVAFQKALQHIDDGVIEERERALMLARLAKGQINQLTKGDWDLAKEIWRREIDY